MMVRRLFVTVAGLFCFLAGGVSVAHIDMLSQVIEPDPLVRSFEAESLPALGKTTVVDDPRATGGKAVALGGEGAGFKVDLGRLGVGMHCLYLAAKVTDADMYIQNKGPESKPLYFHLRVNDQPGGGVTEHRVRVPYSGDYEYMTRIYFHTPEERAYSAEVFIGPRSVIKGVTVDRVEVRNPLGGLTFAALKTKQVLHTPEEIALLRSSAEKEKKMPKPLRAQPLSAEERAQRDAVIWNESMMPINATPGQIYGSFGRAKPEADAVIKAAAEKLGKDVGAWKLTSNAYDVPWKLTNAALGLEYTMADYNAGRTLPAPWPIPEDKAGVYLDAAQWKIEKSVNYGFVPALMQARYHAILVALGGTAQGQSPAPNLPQRYLLTNDSETAADGAFLLAAYAYRYPAYEYNLLCLDSIVRLYRTFNVGSVFGRGCSYQGWSGPEVSNICRAYDKLYPYIAGSPELAQRVGRFVPWVKTPEDVVKLIDTFFLQRACQDAVQQVLYSDVLCPAAVALGPNAVSEKYLDRYFTRIYLRDTLCGFPDGLNGGYSRDGLNYIGSAFYTVGESKGELMESADLLKRYVRAGGAKRFDVSDPAQFPRLSAMADAMMRLQVAGGYRAGIGDVGDPQAGPRSVFDKEDGDFLLTAWRWTKDARAAWLLVNTIGQRLVTDGEWGEIVQSAAGARDPVVYTPSHVAEGFGLATLEEGADNPDRRHRNAVMFRFGGIGSGHAHGDALDIELYAYGVKMSGDLGGRPDAGYGYPKTLMTRVHNAVEVDEVSFTGGPTNATAYGWLEAFSPAPGCQFAMARARGEGQPQVNRYQRGVLQVLCDPGNEKDVKPSAYVFDVFRTAGGKTHTWCFHGCVSDEFTTNADLKPAVDETAKQYLAGYYKETQREAAAPAVLEATWQLRRAEAKVDALTLRNAEQIMLEKLYEPQSPMKYCRVSLFGHEGDKVLVANWYAKLIGTRMFNFPFVHVRRDGAAGLESVHTALMESYAGKPFVLAKKALKVQDAGAGAGAPVAVEVETAFNQKDFLFSAGERGKAWTVENGARASGDLAFVSRDAQGVRLAHLVGGRELDCGNLSIRLPRAEYRARIAAVDYAAQRVTLDAALPAGLLDHEMLTLGNPRHQAVFEAVEAKGTSVALKRTSLTYQGGVELVDAQGGFAQLDLAPYLHSYHRDYYEGMTVVNESGVALGKAAIKLGDRFFYTGWPAVRRHLAYIKPGDLTDENKDGKVTVTMIATERQKKFAADGKTIIEVKPGEKMLDMEITRLRPDGLMLYVKQFDRVYLDSLNTPHPGWPYDRQVIRNERGDRDWVVSMPGDVYQLHVAGRKLADADTPDANGDGRRMVYLHEYGVGDELIAPARVALRRLEPGLYEVRANTAFSITLPGVKAQLSADGGKTWTKAAVKGVAGGRVSVEIGEAEMGLGVVTLDVR